MGGGMIYPASRKLDGASATPHPIPTREYPLPAKRSFNSRLSNDKLERVFGVLLPDWRQALCRCMQS